MSGVFISFEGGEGSGKTTIASMIKEALTKEGYHVVLTREPGGVEIAEKIRDIIHDVKYTNMDRKTEALLYAASRRQHLVEKVIPALEKGYIVGYSDARGLVDSEGRTPEGMETPETSIAVEDNYRPHPAFEDGSDTGYKQGEWDERLEGIWVGKFETTEKVQDKITVLPNKASYRNETMNTFYNDARALNIANSHVMKNSEWGALVYLTKSKYGKNDVAGKFLEDCITGGGDYKTNISQSTTGNIYGIYDTVAGTYERTTSYIANSLVSEGNVFTSTDGTVNNKTTSTKYATVYNMASNDTKVDNYNANINKIFGDAMIETSTAGEGFETWENSFSEFSIGNTPFITRGAGYNITEVSQFYFYNNNGTPSIDAGFRLACIVK